MSDHHSFTFLYAQHQRVRWADDPGHTHLVVQQRVTFRGLWGPVVEYRIQRVEDAEWAGWAYEADLVVPEEERKAQAAQMLHEIQHPQNPSGAFQECESCKAKPGTPTLCAGCLHNRQLIATYQAVIRRTWAQ